MNTRSHHHHDTPAARGWRASLRAILARGLPIEFLFWGFVAGLWMLWEVLFRYGWFYDTL